MKAVLFRGEPSHLLRTWYRTPRFLLTRMLFYLTVAFPNLLLRTLLGLALQPLRMLTPGTLLATHGFHPLP